MKTLETLKAELLADGVIDAAEVQELKEILYADGIIDKDEANFLFELNDAVSGKENDASWEGFFVQAISDFLLKDEVSPNEIDEDEYLAILNNLLMTKRKSVHAENEFELTNKLVRFALSRGFEMKDIRHCITLSDENDNLE